MKNGLALFLGAFATLALSWAGVLLTAHRQFGALTQYRDPVEETLHPAPLSGLADQGRAVYQDLGCVACHTQQVRRDGFGGDIAREWGTRQSVAHDYIRERTVFLGHRRLGPDLRNVAARRRGDADTLHNLLYAPASVAPGSNMPSYAFLYTVRRINPAQPAAAPLDLPEGFAPPEGYEVVPTARAQALVAYLRSLKDTYEYPEARPYVAPAPSEGGH